MIAAACSSDTEETTTTTAAPTTTTTTVAAFDLVASVDEYLANIPDGFLAIGDVQVFKDGVEAVCEGTYREDGTFEATKIQAKCASKYQAKYGTAKATGP